MSATPLARPAGSSSTDIDDSDDELLCASLFRSGDFDTLRPLLRNCPVRRLEEGDVLIAAGRPNRFMYVVLSGRLTVRLSSVESVPLAEIASGEVVGELSTIDRQPTTAFVIASEPTRVLVIDEDVLWMLVNTSHAVSTNLLYMLTQRLRSGNQLLYEHSTRLEQYEYHATVDALTGLFNRHWLATMLPRQMHRARSCKQPFCILMVDIDAFKPYNDSHGHVAGDAALCAVANAMRDCLRPTDMAARYGGEEFLVLLPECAGEHAMMVAERLRATVEALAIAHVDGRALPGVTVSVGIGELAEEGTVEAFVSLADEALYRAKGAGRNQVCR
ncbi:MAG: GGDEF domain-containing protein [Gammaproteobacteria bacterium]